MFSICYCWSKTSQERGESSQCQSSSWATTRSTRWKLSETVQSMPREQTDTFQGYTIWLHGRVTWKKRTPGNLPRLSCTSGRWSAPFTRTTQRNQQQHQHPWTPLRPWPSQRPSSPQPKSEDDRQNALRSAPSEVLKKKRQGRGNKEEATRKRQQGGIRISVVLRARSWRGAGDLSLWRKER